MAVKLCGKISLAAGSAISLAPPRLRESTDYVMLMLHVCGPQLHHAAA